MTRDEHRAKCIEAICRTLALLYGGDADLWQDFLEEGTAAFDSLHGVAFVDPTEATEEMVRAALWNVVVGVCGNYSAIWSAMAAAGNLTNPPEKKT